MGVAGAVLQAQQILAQQLGVAVFRVNPPLYLLPSSFVLVEVLGTYLDDEPRDFWLCGLWL